MSALRTVVGFELRRTLRRRTFWIATLGTPFLMMAYVGLVSLANSATPSTEASKSIAQQHSEYQDLSGVIDAAVAQSAGMTATTDSANAVARVKAGTLEAFIQFPQDPSTQKVEIVEQYHGITGSDEYSSRATTVWNDSLNQRVGNPALVKSLRTSLKYTSVSFDHGQSPQSPVSMIMLAVFPVLLLMFLILQSNQLLSVTLEEKENRISEMLLVSTNATSLVVGKVLAVLTTGLIQVAVLVVSVVTTLLIGLRGSNALSNIGTDASKTGAVSDALAQGGGSGGIDPMRVLVGVVALFAGMVLVTGMCVLLGSMVPTQKEAGNFFGFVMILHIMPLWGITLFVMQPTAPLLNVFRYFPPSSPFTTMIENVLGTNPVWLGLLVSVAMLVVGALVVWLGITVFRSGVIQYDRRFRLRDLVRR